MAASLKRKRGADAAPRKNRKIDDEVDLNSGDSDIEANHASQVDGEEESVQDDGEGEEEEDEWGGIEGAAEEGESTDKIRRPPTGEEIRTIRDAADLFRSGSFKLQIDALLPNVRPKTSRQPPLDLFLRSLHSFLLEIPSISPQHPLEASRELLRTGVSVPYCLPLPTEETNWKVSFEKPSDILLVGSWANKVSVKAKDGKKFGVDVAIEMPDGLFQEKDYLNGRFFQKRAFYLATIANAVKRSKNFNVDMCYSSVNNDPRLTTLVLIPKNDNSHNDFTKLNAQVYIIPVISSTCPIPLHHLSPSHSNIRVKVSEDEGSFPATPLYNTCLLYSLTPRPHLLATHTLKQDSPAFSDALTLLRIWANQRGYGEGSRLCIHGFEGKGSLWIALLHLLVRGEEEYISAGAKANKRRPLGRGLSSYQMFRAVLDLLAKRDLGKEGIFVKSNEGYRFPPEAYRAHHQSVLVDSASLINLLAGVPRGSLELLRQDALWTLKLLDDPTRAGDPFTEVFLKEHREVPTRFDTILRVDISNAKPRETNPRITMDCGSTHSAFISSLDSLLHQGLSDRVKAVTILHPSSTPRPLSQAHPSISSIMYIGLVHDPEHAFRLVDHGPAADEQNETLVQNFRQLWGDKAELRRFKDGRIQESVVWDIKTADEKMHIPALIVRHLMGLHFGLEDDHAVTTWQSGFDSVLKLPPSISSQYINSGAQVGFKNAIQAFDGIVKSMKGLDDKLPLALVQVSPVSALLRYTSTFAPIALPSSVVPLLPPNARYMPSMEIILQFEKSARWPDDLKAIQKMKLAFFEHVATCLMAQEEDLRASIVTGDGVNDSEVLDRASLEIVTPEGWAFSARIWHDREVMLLDRILDAKARKMPHVTVKKSDSDDKNGKEYQEALAAKWVYTKRFIHAPRHHRAIAGLCHMYSAFAGTVRLVKRWLAAHWLLHAHISEEAVEIICSSFFVSAHSAEGSSNQLDSRALVGVPGSKERGFAAVVEFFKEWRWEEELFVPLYAGETNHSSVEDNQEALGRRVGSGSGLGGGGGVWRISTEMDREGKVWTAHGPDSVAANRLKALAQVTWECMRQMEEGAFDVKTIFMHPTEDYDFIIKLDRSVIPRYAQNVAADVAALTRRGKYMNLPSVSSTDPNASLVARPGFDPVRLYFQDLQRIYMDTFRLFYDAYGGDQFGGVWDPSLSRQQPRPFRVLGGYSSAPLPPQGQQKDKKDRKTSKTKDLVTLNESAVLSEIERLGAGLIKEIVVHDT
ncbi:hypothetical protein AMATHDRAFT_178762 [Amanita thiersii Skay4041]|uniref:U3 small nucleolar RNA-associated protein 22 n=1 Tax=Amanita thiersii Skay4041 TaxID=703135 RepID=A0A2A9NP14_9AGAR|nr:hypothetical protein AMATHDRAFT_178762 [Amanita thiersii Skay4041]